MVKENSSTIFFPVVLIIMTVIIVGITMWGYGILQGARSLNEYTANPPEYSFNFGIIPTNEDILYLNSAKFYYDLTTKQAFLGFDINGEENISYVFMDTPEIDNKTIRCFSANWVGFYKESDMNYTEIGCNSTKTTSLGENYNQSEVIVYLDNKTVVNKRIKIEFNLNTEHSFTFDFNVYKQDIFYSDGEGSIIISLGKDYECFQDCVYNLLGFKPVYTDNPAAERHLMFTNTSDESQFSTSFKLITKSIKVADDKNQDIAAGVAIIVGALFATLTLAIEFVNWLFENLIKRRSSFNLGNCIGFLIFCIGAVFMIAGIINAGDGFLTGLFISLVGIMVIIFTWQKPQNNTDEKLRELFDKKSTIKGFGASTIKKLKQFIDEKT